MNRVGQRAPMRSILMGILVLASMLLASCDSGPTNNAKGPSAANGGKGCSKIGILLPETTSSVRWETKDHPLLELAVKSAIPNAQIDYSNAQGNSATQLSQAETDLANGDCMLIVGAHDSVAASSIVAKAKAQNVPVIAYDRLIQSKDLNYYVSFDNVKVGQIQGQYIVDHYQEYQPQQAPITGLLATQQAQKAAAVHIVMISGSQTDTNALLFSMGVHTALDPLFANGSLKNVSENFTPNWDNNVAQAEMEAALADQQNNIQIAYVANDGMADGAITALKAANLNGKVLVTGQDATATGIHNILIGAQSMTVYKPIAKEAQSVGDLVKALYNGTDVNGLTHGVTTTTFDGGNVPSILAVPVAVDRNNIASTVIADNYLSKSDVCAGIPAGTAGVC
ncbi:MAG TPA: substrate-binding domain-containing protein [Ktedonosporobacter sp.]|nr:substrate-binding domain-containing protein [Ktedonosporobacter sp.]